MTGNDGWRKETSELKRAKIEVGLVMEDYWMEEG